MKSCTPSEKNPEEKLKLAKVYLYVRERKVKRKVMWTRTSVAVSPDSKRVYTGAKDAGIVVWELETGAKLFKIPSGRKGQQSSAGHGSVK